MNPIRPFLDKTPQLGARTYVDPACTIIQAFTIEDLCLIGMGACILDGVTVKKYGFVGAGAVVGPGKTVGEGELWLGNHARKARMLSDREIESLHYSAQHYVRLKDRYLGMASSAPR